MALRETFEAVAVGHNGNVLGRWHGGSVKSLMATADAEAPSAWSVTVRGEYTLDGTRFRDHGGRVVATRERGGGRGHGGWVTGYGDSGDAGLRRVLAGDAPPEFWAPKLAPGSRGG